MRRMDRRTVLGHGVTLGQVEFVERRALEKGNDVYARIALRAYRGEADALQFVAKLVETSWEVA